MKVHETTGATWQMWKLEFEGPPRSFPGTFYQTPLPSYDGLGTEQFSTRTQRAEFGTVVTEVTTTSTVTTTRRKYRAEDA